jgi:hypothetical protein
MKRITCLFGLAALALTASANYAGVSMAVDIDVVNKMKNYAMPMVLSELNGLDLGKIEFDGGYVDNMVFNFAIPDYSTIAVSFSGANNAIHMNTQDIVGSLSGKFSYKLLFITASGTFKVTLDKGACTMDTLVLPIGAKVNGKSLPNVDLKNFSFHIDSSKISISLGGSILADIADAFVWIFKSLVVGEINTAVNEQVPGLIKDSINSMLNDMNGLGFITDDVAIDYSFTAQPEVTDSTLALYLNGTVFNKTAGY